MKTFLRSFVYAANGIRTAIVEERNLRFHLCVAVYVYVFSLFYDFGRVEYALLTVVIVGVLAFELVNSAVERSVSRPSPEKYRTAGAVKDIASGAVLVFCIGALACGIFLFWDIPVFLRIFAFFGEYPVTILIFAISVVFSTWFIFGLEKFHNKRKAAGYQKDARKNRDI